MRHQAAMVERQREIDLRKRIAARRGAPKQLERCVGIARYSMTCCIENGKGVLGCGTALFRRHPIPAGSLGLVFAKPEARCVMASEKEAPSLGGILPRAAAEFTQNTEVILTACIAGFRIGLAALVCGGRITTLFGGFGSAKIGGSRP
jgi:hypothetical protein